MKNILNLLPEGLVEKINLDNINEITLRAGKNATVKVDNIYYKIDYIINSSEVKECFRRFCDFSVYAYINEIKNGFITIEGGHRIGICGTAVMEDDNVFNIKDISSVNIRVAKEITGSSDKLKFDVKNLLIVSPPCCGKTTIIRDLCRRIGNRRKVSVVDERGEIAGMCNGMPCFDIGAMTDVLSLAPKKKGIEYMLRSMSPEYIVTDEIADSDCETLKKAVTSGVHIVATAHGNSVSETLERLNVDKAVFDNIVLLSNKYGMGTIEEVFSND